METMKKPLNWIKTRITKGKQDTTLNEHKLTWGKQPLKFYRNKSGRYSVNYKNTHVCTCDESEIVEIQKQFDKQFGRKDIEEISDELKVKYNEKIKRNIKKDKKHRNCKTYKESRLQFEEKPTGRMQVRVNDNGKIHTICQCYPNQKEEIIKRYDLLKKSNDLDSLKMKMKKDYNLRGKARDSEAKHIISINDDGTIYKDGKYIKVSRNIYDLVNGLI